MTLTIVALEAMKAAGSADPAAIKAALRDVTYDGVSGHIAFDDVNGDAVRDTAYIKHSTNDGAWELETVQQSSDLIRQPHSSPIDTVWRAERIPARHDSRYLSGLGRL